MKRLFVITVVLLLLLSACTPQKATPTEPTNTSTPTAPTALDASTATTDHSAPVVNPALKPEVILGPWTQVDSPLLLSFGDLLATYDIEYKVMTDEDSCKYLYVKSDSSGFEKLVDTPISWYIRNRACAIYAPADEQAIYAVCSSSEQQVELLRATRGGFTGGGDLGFYGARLIIRDGDTLFEFDLVEKKYRELVRNQYLQDGFCFDSMLVEVEGLDDVYRSVDLDKVCFVTCLGADTASYVLDLKTGELHIQNSI